LRSSRSVDWSMGQFARVVIYRWAATDRISMHILNFMFKAFNGRDITDIYILRWPWLERRFTLGVT
jgi:hypothetical protein